MIQLSRTVRFCLNDDGGGDSPPRHNSFASWPPMRGLGRFYELDVQCVGEVDPVSGYFMNIRQIDQAVRDEVIPFLQSVVACDASPSVADLGMGGLLTRMMALLQPPLDHSVRRIRLQLTPFFSLTLRSDDMAHVILRQQYDFSAAHRLHVDDWSDEANQQMFGKCNNPSGHGHNYRLEVAVRAPIDDKGRVLQVEQLDAVVDETVVETFDHKHLNVDVPHFADLNPSVENIARVIHDMLEPKVRQLGVTLHEVSVWETGKTVCTYAGNDAAAV